MSIMLQPIDNANDQHDSNNVVGLTHPRLENVFEVIGGTLHDLRQHGLVVEPVQRVGRKQAKERNEGRGKEKG